MADNNKRERDQRQNQGSKKEQKTSSGANGKNMKRDSKSMDKKPEDKDSGRDRRR
ncbi:MAG TPA: hypothetical protein VK166_10105 [Chitinophagaceae bacterium]|nr:hypothetical protein [Chitinophagaceae bacterium]